MSSVQGHEHRFAQTEARYVRLLAGLRAWAKLVARAEDLVRITGGAVEHWMLWDGWILHVGCDVCTDQGRRSLCWGLRTCHGYEHGCGCAMCARRQARDAATAEACS